MSGARLHAPTPGLKAEARAQDEEPLATDDARQHRSNIGRLMLIAHEKSGAQYAAKEIARSTSTPTVGDVSRVKRVARYLAGTKDCENLLSPDHTEKWTVVA